MFCTYPDNTKKFTNASCYNNVPVKIYPKICSYVHCTNKEKCMLILQKIRLCLDVGIQVWYWIEVRIPKLSWKLNGHQYQSLVAPIPNHVWMYKVWTRKFIEFGQYTMVGMYGTCKGMCYNNTSWQQNSADSIKNKEYGLMKFITRYSRLEQVLKYISNYQLHQVLLMALSIISIFKTNQSKTRIKIVSTSIPDELLSDQ